MMKIGIGVDASQVKKAREEVSALGKDLDTINGSQATVGGGQNELVRKLRDDINRLTTLSRAAENRGGVLSTKQLKDVQESTKRVREGFATWTAEIDKAKNALKSLNQERQKLYDELKNKGISGDRRLEIHGRLAGISAEQRAAQQTIDGQQRVAEMSQRAARAGGGLESVEAERAAGGMNIKKALGYGAALLGGGTVLGFLMDAIGKSSAMDVARADAGRRGWSGKTSGAGLGFSPIEEAQLADAISRRTGWRGAGLDSGTATAMGFARTFGIDGEAAAGFMGATRSSTGISPAEYKSYMKSINTLAHTRVEVGRVEEFLDVNKQLLATVSGASGGGFVGAQGTNFLAGLQASLWRQGGAGQNAGILSTLSNTISSGGSNPGQQLMLWNALGGQDAKGLGGYLDIRAQMEKGAGDPKNVAALIRRMGANGMGTSDDMMVGQFSGMGLSVTQSRTLWGALKKQADAQKMSVFDLAGDSEKFAKAFSAGETEFTKEDTSKARTIQAEIDTLKVQIGDALNKPIMTIKQGLIDVANDINKGDLTKALKDLTNTLLLDPAGKYGGKSVARQFSDSVLGFIGMDADSVSKRMEYNGFPSYGEWLKKKEFNERENERRRKEGKSEIVFDPTTLDVVKDEKNRPVTREFQNDSSLARKLDELIGILRVQSASR